MRRDAILEPAYELYREERRREAVIDRPVSLKEEAVNAKEASKAMERDRTPNAVSATQTDEADLGLEQTK